MSDVLERLDETLDDADADVLLAEALQPEGAPTNRHAAARQDEPWRITGTRTAEWVLYMIRREKALAVERIEPVEDAIAALQKAIDDKQAFIDSVVDEAAAEVEHWEALLVAYHRKRRTEEVADRAARYERAGMTPEAAYDKAVEDTPKSWPLSGGTVKSTKRQRTVDVDDRKLLAWAKEHDVAGEGDGLVAYKPHVTKTQVDQWAQRTGRTPDGYTVHEGGHEDDREYKVVLT